MDTTPEPSAGRPGAAPLVHPFLAWDMADEPVQRHLVGLEPRQAWRLRGLGGSPDEIVIPGIVIDDFGRSAPAEATLPEAVYCQMQAMAAVADLRMVEARARPQPRRTQAEANVWLVDGIRQGRRIAVTAIVSLDRLVFAPDRQSRTDTMMLAQIVPAEKARR